MDRDSDDGTNNHAVEIERTARETFGDGKLGALLRTGDPGKWTRATRAIKQTFRDLGEKFGYSVAASGCIGANRREWKYDLAWFVEDQDGYTISLPLILESELKPTGRIDRDFVKLVAGRADLRVWLSCAANASAARDHIDNCMQQVRRFAHSRRGDTYVFIIFEWLSNSVTIETRVNESCTDARGGDGSVRQELAAPVTNLNVVPREILQ
jgi:hypothetical protein